MEICHWCRKAVLASELVWGARVVASRTMSSPEEYSDEPFHESCLVEQGEEAEAKDMYLLDEHADRQRDERYHDGEL